ncbi:aspartate--tRNA ligase, mitochondrial [Trichomonascus vanleenenianus]|uniref:aspartate--tRNA ligase MSD1 n=1 Tax=Trichomonascus vanleenenianus TaxID=2268995 RepID=UPI003EC9AF5B
MIRAVKRVLARGMATLPPKEETVRKFRFPTATSTVSQATANHEVTMHGWVHRKPKKMGKGLVFGKLRDTNGDMIQLVDRNDPPLIKSLQPESAISVTGTLKPREGAPSGESPADLELEVEELAVLNQSSLVGSQLTTGTTKEWPPEHRYLQLREAKFQKNLKTRAQVMRTCRTVLDSIGFTEVETPLLFKSTPEGAREFLVPTRRKQYTYALPQSPQQYKQLLMASGVHRYYQIAKCFRDEDLRQDRQAEFTQLDMEMSFATAKDVQACMENVVQAVWKQVLDTELYTMDVSSGMLQKATDNNGKFNPLKYTDALERFGIDKPDLRSSIEIINLSGVAKATEHPDFPVLEAIVLKNAATINSSALEILADTSQYSLRVPVVVEVGENNDILSAIAEIAEVSDAVALETRLGAVAPGDIVAFGTRASFSYENPTPLGRFRQIAIDAFPQHYLRPGPSGAPLPRNTFVANWVVDFPLFNPAEQTPTSKVKYPAYDYGSYVTTHHPFTMARVEDYDLLATDPLQVRGQHYDLVINGVEVGGGSVRIHDVDLQRFVFDEILNIPHSKKLFEHLLRAFSTGCPPHAGMALGFDRLTAMLCGTSSIRDVIAFPKTITGADPMIGCPSKATPAQLAVYHLSAKN